MSKGIILFESKYGATQKYATWLSEMTGFECHKTSSVKAEQLKDFDIIVLGGGVYASGILGFSFLKKNFKLLKDKKIAVFAVGASPFEEKAVNQIKERLFTGDLVNLSFFYCRGAWDEDAMSITHRTLCKMLQKAVAKKDPCEYEPWESALMCAVGQKCDWTDKKYLEPIVKWIEEGK